MRRYLTLLIGLLLALSLASGLTEPLYQLCENTREIYTNCTMLTPDLGCSAYNYDVINMTGGVQETGSLKQFNDSIYYFNLTVSEGDYIIRLCDNSTREIRVLEEDNQMIPAIIILIPMILAIILVVGAATFGRDHTALKIFLFLISVILFFVSMHFAVLGIVKFYAWPELLDVIGTTSYWFGITFVVIIVYFLLYIVWKGLGIISQKKKENLEGGPPQ